MPHKFALLAFNTSSFLKFTEIPKERVAEKKEPIRLLKFFKHHQFFRQFALKG